MPSKIRGVEVMGLHVCVYHNWWLQHDLYYMKYSPLETQSP